MAPLWSGVHDLILDPMHDVCHSHAHSLCKGDIINLSDSGPKKYFWHVCASFRAHALLFFLFVGGKPHPNVG